MVEFEELQFSEFLDGNESTLMDLYHLKKQGFLIRNFLSGNEVSSILNNFSKVELKDVAKTPSGFTYPMVFAEYSLRNSGLSEQELAEKNAEYFRKCANYGEEFKADFGFDLKSRIDDMLSYLSGGKQIANPAGIHNIGTYPFGNFRYLTPGGGAMAIHCGNFFQHRFETFYSHLSQTVNVTNQLSYFIMLHEAEEGGLFEVFDLKWEEGQTKRDNLENEEIILRDGSILKPDTDSRYTSIKLRPTPGDLILFQGGSLWHRVIELSGSKPRITFGGFLAPSKDMETFYYWT